jgi:hypothetical protein
VIGSGSAQKGVRDDHVLSSRTASNERSSNDLYTNNNMQTRNTISYLIALYLPLLCVVATDNHCATDDFVLRFYAVKDKYALKYDVDNPSDPDTKYITPNPDYSDGSPYIPMDSYHFAWNSDEVDGGNNTKMLGQVGIKREQILDPHTFVLEFSDRVTLLDMIPLNGTEAKGQSTRVSQMKIPVEGLLILQCVLQMSEDPCVQRLSWYLGWGVDIAGEELAEGFPVKGADSLSLICEGDLRF